MDEQKTKICLVAVNSKYIHTNPAVYSLCAYAKSRGISCSVLEFSINQPQEDILAGLMETGAELYAFSVYIWNCDTVFRIARELKKLRPEAALWCGGPEVSYHAGTCLRCHPELDGIMRGEGEETFAELCRAYLAAFEKRNRTCASPNPGQSEWLTLLEKALAEIRGLTYRREDGTEDGTIAETPDREPMDMAGLVFPFSSESIPDPNRIVYYESSRGCPFLCTYCLSCLEKKLRFKPLPKVFEELEYFLKAGVKQVKFVDRTFNADKAHALAIWQYLKDYDNGITNFHFEVCAELLSEEAITLLNSLRPGQVQLEIGVQTTNTDTLRAICRQRNSEKLRANVRRLLKPHNIHVHLDLIAGLPYEGFESFRNSFNEVYALKPQQLQLGFLKVLKGTPMESFAKEHGFLTGSYPPYEVLSTPWLSYEELRLLKGVENMVEIYYNSHQFEKTMARLENDAGGTGSGAPFHADARSTGLSSAYDTSEVGAFAATCSGSAFDLYLALAAFMHQRGHDKKEHGRMERYELLLEFIRASGLDVDSYIPLLLYDYCARERLKHWPAWAGEHRKPEGFDYEHRDPLTGNALLTIV